MPTTAVSPSPETAAPAARANTRLPVTAGVEIECNYPTGLRSAHYGAGTMLLNTIASELRALGIPALSNNDLVSRTNHGIDTGGPLYHYWHIGTDCSCGIECRSRIFTHLEAMETELKNVCQVLANHGISADDACGLHVHLGTSVAGPRAINKFHQCLMRNEDNLFRLVPRQRRGNPFCPALTWNSHRWLTELIATGHSHETWGARYWFHQSSKGTTEIRIQKGSVDAAVIYGWIGLLEQLWLASQQAQFDPEWRVLRVISQLSPEVRRGFPTKLSALAAANRILKPGGNTPFLLAAKKYLKQFNHAA